MWTNPEEHDYLGKPVGSWVSLVFLSEGEGDGDGLERCVRCHSVTVHTELHRDVGLGAGDHIPLDHTNT